MFLLIFVPNTAYAQGESGMKGILRIVGVSVLCDIVALSLIA